MTEIWGLIQRQTFSEPEQELEPPSLNSEPAPEPDVI